MTVPQRQLPSWTVELSFYKTGARIYVTASKWEIVIGIWKGILGDHPLAAWERVAVYKNSQDLMHLEDIE